MTAPIAVERQRASNHRWLRRLLLALIFAILAGIITALVWVLLVYRQLEGDLHSSQQRLPRAVAASLAPGGSVLDRPQLTVVSPIGLGSTSAAPILFRTDPDGDVMALLSLPALRKTSDAALIRRVRRAAHFPVNHSILVSLPGVASVVDALGGITVRNPRSVDYLLRDGRYWHFHAGNVRLDGQHVVAYMEATEEREAPVRQQLVLEAVIRALLAPTTISDASRAARAVTASLATDLTSSQVLGLAWLRFHSRYLLQCKLAQAPEAWGQRSVTALNAFLGRTTIAPDDVPTGCGLSRLRPASVPLPPTSVVRAVASVYPRLWQVGLAVLAAAVILAVALLLFRRPRMAQVTNPRPAGVSNRGRRRGASLHSLRRWGSRKREDIAVYAFAALSSVAVTYVALHLI